MSPTASAAAYRLLFSGVESGPFRRVLDRLGAVETNDPLLGTHLVTDRPKRTLKMLFARVRGIPVVSVDWLMACRTRQPKQATPGAFVCVCVVMMFYFVCRENDFVPSVDISPTSSLALACGRVDPIQCSFIFKCISTSASHKTKAVTRTGFCSLLGLLKNKQYAQSCVVLI